MHATTRSEYELPWLTAEGVSGDAPGVHVTARTDGAVTWEARYPLARFYPTPFARAAVRVLEARYEPGHAWVVVAEPYDTTPAGTWPPWEFACNAAHAIERTRPGARVEVLLANNAVQFGPAAGLMERLRSPGAFGSRFAGFEVRDETARELTLYADTARGAVAGLTALGFAEAYDGFEERGARFEQWTYTLRVAKDDPRLMGPFVRMARLPLAENGEALVRIGEERGELAMLVGSTDFARAVGGGFEEWRGGSTLWLAYRWVPRSRLR